MRVKSVLAATAGLFIAALAGSMPADARQPVPPGSYMATCRDANIFMNTSLVAFCRNAYGQFVFAQLPNYMGCRGDIANMNGQLVCNRRGGGGGGWGPGGGGGWNPGGGGYRPPPPPPPGPGRFPPGSYLQSCNGVRVFNGWLQANCADVRGNWRQTQAPVNQCRAFANNNGRLVCG
ncbi:hypothetical protein ACLBXM_02290 [Xanthobacteraceae bacterium A53D]